MAGRPRKPSHLKVVAGTDQPCRMNRNEPKPDRERPSPPAHLSTKARDAWGYVSAKLDEMGVLTNADGLALEQLCEAYAELQEARAALADRKSLTYETVTKIGGRMVRAYPEAAMVRAADSAFQGWLSKFGLTPADRSRVSIVPKAGGNKFSEFG